MRAVYECEVAEAPLLHQGLAHQPVLSSGQSQWTVALPPADGWEIAESMVEMRGHYSGSFLAGLLDQLPTIQWADRDVLVNAGLLSSTGALAWPPNRHPSVEELRRRERGGHQ